MGEEIQQQLRRNENEARLKKIQEFLNEKKHAEQIIKEIERQVKEENLAARAKMQEINNMMHEGVRLREQELERRRRVEEAQDKAIKAHKHRVAHRNDKLIALKKAQAEAKEKIRLKIEADALQKQKEEADMLEALDVLRKERKEKEDEQKEREKAQKRLNDKMMMSKPMNAREQRAEREKNKQKPRRPK